MKPIRILLADDHALVRAGLRALLAKLKGIEVVAEAADGREAIRLALKHKPDVALMDVAMPRLNGIDAASRIDKQLAATRVIMLSMHANEDYIRQAFRAGASAYLLKSSSVVELAKAIKSVRAGKNYLCAELARRYKPEQLLKWNGIQHPAHRLTARQREILQLIAESRTTKEIAAELGVSTKTVEFHRAKLMGRLKIHDVPGLVRYALRTGLAESEV
jgi:DNA-binding NarL/FixJ family response regulator